MERKWFFFVAQLDHLELHEKLLFHHFQPLQGGPKIQL